jgi:hypothetical protein
MSLTQYKIPAICLVAGLCGGVVVAKYTLPPKTVTKTETKIQIQEKIVYQDRIVKEQGPVRITTKTVTVPGPAGPTVTVEKVVEKDKVTTVIVNQGGVDTTTKMDEKTSKTVDARSWLALEGVAGIAPGTGRWAGSGAATMRVFGPLWAGVGIIKADTWYFGPAARWEF